MVLGKRSLATKSLVISTRDQGQDGNLSRPAMNLFPHLLSCDLAPASSWSQQHLHAPELPQACTKHGHCVSNGFYILMGSPLGCADRLLPAPRGSIPPASLSQPNASEETSDKRNPEQNPGVGKWQPRACVRSAGSPGLNN